MDINIGISSWEETCVKDEIDAMFYYCSGNETGNVVGEVPALQQKGVLDEMCFIVQRTNLTSLVSFQPKKML